jgi:tetratricopeptide (TPR) repeat protein
MRRLGLAAILILALIGCGDPAEKALHDGYVYFQQQDNDRAIECYEQAIKHGARVPEVYNMLGLAYRFKNQRLGDPGLQGREIEAFQTAVKMDPKYWVAMVNLGTTLYSRGDKDQAAYWFRKALVLKPDHPEKARLEKMIAAAKSPGASKKSRRHETRRED